MPEPQEDLPLQPTPDPHAPDPALAVRAIAEQFQLGRQPLYDEYLKPLKIKPTTYKGQVYVTQQERDDLVQVIRLVKSGEFASAQEAYAHVQQQRSSSLPASTAQSKKSAAVVPALSPSPIEGAALNQFSILMWFQQAFPTVVGFLNNINDLLVQIANKPNFPAPSPLADYELIEEAWAKQWQLPTSRLAQILEIQPGTLQSKQSYEWGGFRFTKAGKMKREASWKISKLSEQSLPEPNLAKSDQAD